MKYTLILVSGDVATAVTIKSKINLFRDSYTLRLCAFAEYIGS